MMLWLNVCTKLILNHDFCAQLHPVYLTGIICPVSYRLLCPVDGKLSSLCVCSLVPGYSTFSSRAHPVWSSGQSALWCWAAWPWAQRTTSSPWWTVTSSLPFFKVGLVHTYTHACKYSLHRTSTLVSCRGTHPYNTCVLFLQVSFVQTWSSLKLVFDVYERFS